MLIVAYSERKEKPVEWMGSSRKDMRECPDAVQKVVGFALWRAQEGRTHPSARPMKGALRDVIEIGADTEGATYRATYTVRFAGVVYVLSIFKKKSTHGIKTPQRALDLIRKRLAMAQADYERHYSKDR